MHLSLRGLPEVADVRTIQDHQARLLPCVPAIYSEPEQKSMLALLSPARLALTVKESVQECLV